RLANVVGTAFEGQAKNSKAFAAQGPQGVAHLAQESLTLILIDADDFIEQAEFISAFSRDRAEGHEIFGEARASITDSGIQKPWSDAAVGSDALADLLDIGSDRFADAGHCIDEGNLHRQKSVRSMLDKFGALCAGDDHGRRNECAVRPGNRIFALIVG